MTRVDAGTTSTRIFHSYSELDGWQRLPTDNFHLSTAWLRNVDGALSPTSAFVIVEDRDHQATAGLCAYPVTEDAFPFQNPQKLLLREEWRLLLGAFQSASERSRTAELCAQLSDLISNAYPVATCVVPFAFRAALAYDQNQAAILDPLLHAFDTLAEAWGARSSAFLYVPESQSAPLVQRLSARGYSCSALAGRCTMPTTWASFDSYLASFSSHRRTSIRKELRAVDAAGLRVEMLDGSEIARLHEELAYLSAKHQEKYGHGFDLDRERATFQRFRTYLADCSRLSVVWKGDKLVAFLHLFEYGGKLYASVTGQDYDALGDTFAHFTAVYYEPIRHAIRHNLSLIDYSIESYDLKVSRGCDLEVLIGAFDFGPEARDAVAELLTLTDTAERRYLSSCLRLHRARS